MKNKEKYAKKIVEIACSGDTLAVSKVTGKPISCTKTSCEHCNCYNDFLCEEKRLREWAESECIKKPVINKMDRAFLDYLNCNYKYIARDMSGELYVHFSKPHKIIHYWNSTDELSNGLKIFNIDFPMIKWSDSEPWLIEDLKKLEVVEEYE